MTRTEQVLAGFVLVFAGAIGVAVASAPKSPASSVDSRESSAGPDTPVDTILDTLSAPSVVPDLENVKRQIAYAAPNTYIGDVITNHDSAIVRWPDERRTLRVWVQSRSNVAGYQPLLSERVRVGFRSWNGTQPVTFELVDDSASADVPVIFIDHMTQAGRIGVTELLQRDDSVVSATVQIAMHTPEGELLPDTVISTCALHEAGHVLGLPHTADTSSVMFASSTVGRLSERDKATVRLLYSLPIGSLRAAK